MGLGLLVDERMYQAQPVPRNAPSVTQNSGVPSLLLSNVPRLMPALQQANGDQQTFKLDAA